MSAITADDIEQSRELGKSFYQRILPVVQAFIEEAQARGLPENAIMICLTTESLVLAGRAYAGDEDLFIRMAQRALQVTQQKLIEH